MGENPAKDFLDRIYSANTAKDLRAARLDVIQACERSELSDAEEQELLAAAEDRAAEIKKNELPPGQVIKR